MSALVTPAAVAHCGWLLQARLGGGTGARRSPTQHLIMRPWALGQQEPIIPDATHAGKREHFAHSHSGDDAPGRALRRFCET
mmetsp:Transcript_85855/g.199581  ORF Transcript_85855/g.199581 Transcript_85855/m.199581 type:complete len:82 (+) Transcript_85855:543-788(+)